MSVDLAQLGYGPDLEEALRSFKEPDLIPARVAVELGVAYTLLSAQGELPGDLPGRLRKSGEKPAVGDWVACRVRQGEGRASIAGLLPRRTAFSRKTAGKEATAQVVAANIDVVFLMTSLNKDLNARRLERYLTVAHESGARPVVVLSKADLSADPVAETAQVLEVARGVPVHAVSALTGAGVEALLPYLPRGQTGVLLGSSGVGKSTLVNRLVGQERQAVAAIREADDQGRHTTTRRELILLPSGGLLIDTPGMRELGLWDAREGLGEAFPEIEALAASCRFNDCQHHQEPGCAVQQAVKDGQLPPARLDSFHKLQGELNRLNSDPRTRAEQRKQARNQNKPTFKKRR